jgi:hypothetical protein
MTAWADSIKILNVKNNVPALSGLNASLKEFKEGNSTMISFVGSDVEDNSTQLRVEMQYNKSKDVWTNVTNITVSDNTYSVLFGKNVSAGQYGIRIRLIDSDGDTSEWKYENVSILSGSSGSTLPGEFKGVYGNTFSYDFMELTISLLVSIIVLVVTTVLVAIILKKKGVASG